MNAFFLFLKNNLRFPFALYFLDRRVSSFQSNIVWTVSLLDFDVSSTNPLGLSSKFLNVRSGISWSQGQSSERMIFFFSIQISMLLSSKSLSMFYEFVSWHHRTSMKSRIAFSCIHSLFFLASSDPKFRIHTVLPDTVLDLNRSSMCPPVSFKKSGTQDLQSSRLNTYLREIDILCFDPHVIDYIFWVIIMICSLISRHFNVFQWDRQCLLIRVVDRWTSLRMDHQSVFELSFLSSSSIPSSTFYSKLSSTADNDRKLMEKAQKIQKLVWFFHKYFLICDYLTVNFVDFYFS